jgi:MFS family permease
MDKQVAPESLRPSRLPRNVKVLGWASLLNDVASEMIYPLLSTFLINVLGGTTTWLGIIDGTAESISSFVKLWSGGRSDRGGRRKGFVLFGYGIANLARPLTGIIAFPWQLFGVRVADRIGKGVRTPPRDALIADSTEAAIRGRAFGFHRAMDHLGAAIGPLLAAVFLWFWPGAMRELFLLTLVPGALVVVLLLVGLRERERPRAGSAADGSKETETPAGAASVRGGQWSLRPFDRSFRLYLLALVVFTLGNSSDLFLLTRAAELGVDVWLLPILWCMFGLVKSGGNMFAGRVVDRVGPRPMILLGWLFYAAIYLAFGLATAAWHVWTLFIAYAVFYAITEPAEKTLVANLVAPEHRGLAYGWFNCAIGIATLPASLIFGVLYGSFGESGPLIAFGSGAGLALAAALLLSRLPRP